MDAFSYLNMQMCYLLEKKKKTFNKSVSVHATILAVIILHYGSNEKSINNKRSIYFRNNVVLNFMSSFSTVE